MSASKIGVNFRGSSGFVTDGTDETYCLADVYPVTRGGWTFGFETTPTATNLDRNSGVDQRLAGLNGTNFGTFTFRVDLPATGAYWVRLAMGDIGGGAYILSATVEIRDTTTALTSFVATQTPPDFLDATNTTYTAANWPGSNTRISQTFATTIFRMYMSDAGGGFAQVSHIGLERQVVAASSRPIFRRSTRFFTRKF